MSLIVIVFVCGIAAILFGLWYGNIAYHHAPVGSIHNDVGGFFILIGVLCFVVFGLLAMFGNEIESRHNSVGGTILIVDDDGKLSYAKDGDSYKRFKIPFVSKPLKFREYLIKGEERVEVPMDVVSVDGIPMTCTIDMKFVKKTGKQYNYEEIFNLAKKYGLGWPEYVAKDMFAKRYTEYAQIHTAEYLYRNGIYDPEVTFGSHNLYTLGEYRYKDTELQEKIDDKIYEEYHSNDPKFPDFSSSLKQPVY